MFFIDPLELDRSLRQLRQVYGGIGEDLRGWNWSNDILSPPLEGVYLGVSEIANRYCSTYRDVYLRRVLEKPAPYTYKTVKGWLYHAVSSRSVQEVKSILYRRWPCNGTKFFILLQERKKELIESLLTGYRVQDYLSENDTLDLRRESEVLFDYIILQAAARLDRILSEVTKIPDAESIIAKAVSMDVERLVNGRLLGLSHELRVDMFTDRRVVIDIKTGEVRDFHRYTLAGYALAIESDLEIPIDYGIITYLLVDEGIVKVKNMVYFIGDELRREFIEMRDEAFNVIHNNMDPGKPPACPSYCIYYSICNG
jgi:CRISPR-associated protein Csa1